jgi:hypothetical protein
MPSIFGTTNILRAKRNHLNQKTSNKYGSNRRGDHEHKKLLLMEEEPNLKRMMLYLCVIFCCGVILRYFRKSKSVTDVFTEL